MRRPPPLRILEPPFALCRVCGAPLVYGDNVLVWECGGRRLQIVECPSCGWRWWVAPSSSAAIVRGRERERVSVSV